MTPVILEEATLVRVLQCAYPPKCRIWWSPFAEITYKAENEAHTTVRFNVALPASRVAGLVAGRTYASSALPSVEG